jgi:competence protein ComEC
MDTLRIFLRCMLAVLLAVASPVYGEFEPSGKLEIHYINVGQGGCTLVIGPDGTRILYDFGAYDGGRDIVPYLRDVVKLDPSDGIHYAIVSHRDRDHYMGYRAVVEAGYDVLVANYDSGSPKLATTIRSNWLQPAKNTKAGAALRAPVGLAIALGDGAEALVVAANGKVWEEPPVKVSNENDRSVVLFIHYKNFQYVLDGDLGAGRETCTDHQTTQIDVQTRVARTLLSHRLITPENGVDVLHIAHHGSESSTSAAYFNLMKPEVGLISVGQKNSTYLHPREDVVDKVLIGPQRPSCVKAPPVKDVFQTEDGERDCSSTGCTSFTGTAIGDIRLVTDGERKYEITGSNRVHGGRSQGGPGKRWSFDVDEAP